MLNTLLWMLLFCLEQTTGSGGGVWLCPDFTIIIWHQGRNVKRDARITKDNSFGDVAGRICFANNLWHEIPNAHAFLVARDM